jgi:hypothetical protein
MIVVMDYMRRGLQRQIVGKTPKPKPRRSWNTSKKTDEESER